MSSAGFFVTGTDTGIGKTHVSVSLIRLLRARGLRVVGMKPVASGAERLGGNWQNEDALALMAASSPALPYDWVNPYVFEAPVSPHLAAAQAGRRVELAHLIAAYRRLTAFADCVIVEGAGGWRVPLNPDEDIADLAVQLGLPVLQVVGMRLGCINHACLTQAAMQAKGVWIAGWVANHLERELPCREEVLATLTDRLGEPPLGELGFVDDFSHGESTVKNVWRTGEILRRLGSLG
jgi:dethiobiotin synthetase